MNIRKIIREEIDDLEWARDAINTPAIPANDGISDYILRFGKNTPREIFEWVGEEMERQGWEEMDEDSLESLINYSASNHGVYIRLRSSDGRFFFGSSPETFLRANDRPIDIFPNIWITE